MLFMVKSLIKVLKKFSKSLKDLGVILKICVDLKFEITRKCFNNFENFFRIFFRLLIINNMLKFHNILLKNQ